MKRRGNKLTHILKDKNMTLEEYQQEAQKNNEKELERLDNAQKELIKHNDKQGPTNE
jgi:cytidylate kinase